MSRPGRLVSSTVTALEAAVHAALAALAAFVPFRDGDCWVFGARTGEAFADNPKYLFLHVADEQPEVRAVWLTRDRSVVRHLQSRGYEAYHVWSPRGVWLALRAGVAVLSHSTRDVNRWFLGGATVAMLWHGVPLKTVSWDAELPDRSLLDRLALRSIYDRYHVVTVPGPDVVDPLASGLGLDEERFVVTGYPRNDALLGAFPEADHVVDDGHLARIRALDGDRPVVLYLPTFRSDGTRASERLDLDALASTLDALDATLIVKLHPRESFEDANESDDRIAFLDADGGSGAERSALDDAGETDTRILVLPSDVDVYPLLAETDALVTDYSSVYFDYLLADRPVVFFPYDLDRYESTRGLYFEYGSVTPGPVVRTQDALGEALRTALEDDPHAGERAAVRERFLTEGEAGDRVERTFRAVRSRQDRGPGRRRDDR